MIIKKQKENKARTKPVSLGNLERNVIKKNLNVHGEFSGFVRWCLNQPFLIMQFKKEK